MVRPGALPRLALLCARLMNVTSFSLLLLGIRGSAMGRAVF